HPARLKVAIAWHMHPPEYRDLATGEYTQPWTYLHAIPDYADMAAHLEAVPQVRLTVNFAPVLLEQIDDYAQQLERHLQGQGALSDPLLAALAAPAPPADPKARLALVSQCLRANRARLIERFAPYRQLARIADLFLNEPTPIAYAGDQFFADLVAWYHLAWLGESVRRTDARVQSLIEAGTGFTAGQRRVLLEVVADQIAGLRGRYRRLAERGQIELAMSPYAHPMLPLLLDFSAARDALPQSALPTAAGYPGGRERVRWHLRRGISIFERWFGTRPIGCWPSEGGVSDAALECIAAEGFRWVATGEAVLRNSVQRAFGGIEHDAAHRLWRHAPSGLKLIARDDGLSDQIGFTYATWHGDDAAEDLVNRLGNIADQRRGDPTACVAIILDGENAWEYYPENGWHFLSRLYRRLAEHPRLNLVTPCELAEKDARELPSLVAGSWVYGTFSTWIGAPEKNRGWDLLCEAKAAFDDRLRSGMPDAVRERLEVQLGVCEGSDWFWWFGDYNPAAAVSDFERLYRLQLANLYRLLERAPPPALEIVLSQGAGMPAAGGVMRSNQPGTAG
ncbi:MAG: glycoside hydrolase, partial [Gammaproteobacteria bacterium]